MVFLLTTPAPDFPALLPVSLRFLPPSHPPEPNCWPQWSLSREEQRVGTIHRGSFLVQPVSIFLFHQLVHQVPPPPRRRQDPGHFLHAASPWCQCNGRWFLFSQLVVREKEEDKDGWSRLAGQRGGMKMWTCVWWRSPWQGRLASCPILATT